jgi:hypothetical protein
VTRRLTASPAECEVLHGIKQQCLTALFFLTVYGRFGFFIHI